MAASRENCQSYWAEGPDRPAFLYRRAGSGLAASIEPALFGYDRGTFVGAFESRKGLPEQSDGATLILNEVEGLPAPIRDRLVEALSVATPGDWEPLAIIAWVCGLLH
jgi:sigma-54 interacting transcriptional regulator